MASLAPASWSSSAPGASWECGHRPRPCHRPDKSVDNSGQPSPVAHRPAPNHHPLCSPESSLPFLLRVGLPCPIAFLIVMITAPKHHHEPGHLHALARFVLKQQCDTVISSVADEELRLRKVRCFDQSHTALKWQCQDWSVLPRTVPLARTRTRGAGVHTRRPGGAP